MEQRERLTLFLNLTNSGCMRDFCNVVIVYAGVEAPVPPQATCSSTASGGSSKKKGLS